jgi:carbonic anhydrase
MPPSPVPTRTLAPAFALVLLLGLCPGARASDAHAEATARSPAAPAKTGGTPTEPVKAGPASPGDPLDKLREALATKLGATPASSGKGAAVVQVPSRASGEVQLQAIKPAARSSRPRGAAGDGGAAHGAPAGADPKAHSGVAVHAGPAHWSYEGEAGPAAWGALKPEFVACSAGKRQSPIDIRDGFAVDLEPVQFDYRPSGFSVIDNGHTVQVNVGAGNSIEVTGRRYELLQFHFHRPSEERINGRAFDMVAHLVHKDLEGRLAVVAVMLDRGSPQPLVQTVWNNLPLERGEAVPARDAIDLNELLPQDRRYFTYMGSLTTPPCSEGVLWLVMQQPVGVSPQQISLFSRLYPMNARPIQPAAGRMIKQSN